MNSKAKNNKHKKGNLFYDFVKVTGAPGVAIWMRPKIITVGKINSTKLKGGMLICSNHVSFYDPILIHCAFWRRRLSCLATKDLFCSPFKDFFFTHTHCIKVDKQNFNINTLHEVLDTLKDERPVVIFPEGAVNHSSDDFLAFKSGIVLMALRSKKPIVPVYIVKRTKKLQRYTVVVGEPIDVCNMIDGTPSLAALNEICLFLKQKEIDLKNFYETNYVKKEI